LLGEALGRLVWVKGHSGVTAEMVIRYKRPAETGKPLIITASIVSVDGRVITCQAVIRKPDGTALTEATSKMVTVKE
jgi:acyl-CoA thioesterase FadM